MSKKFNLLSLQQPEDVHPRTWICVKEPGLRIIVKRLEKEILETHGYCRETLSREFAIYLHCAHGVIKRILQGKSEFYPIPILLELLKLSKNRRRFLKDIGENIEYMKVNSASAKPVKAVHKLNENLAKILGAFMADGSLSIQVVIAAPHSKDLGKIRNKFTKLNIRYSTGNAPSRNQYYISIRANKDNLKLLNKAISTFHPLTQTHYSLELSDEYKDNVEAFVRWMKEEFDINPTNFRRERNAWRVLFSNKILARYLMHFFGVKPGPKAYDAFESAIIKTSNLKNRKAFAKGVLMFDGCVTKQSKILFSSVSKNLCNSIKQIWEKDNIKFGKTTYRSKSGYNYRTNQNLSTLFTTADNKKQKLLKYFEENTQKWKLLNWLSGDLNYTPPIIKANSSLSVEKILKILQKIRKCDADFLEKYFRCSHSTVRSHLKILKAQKRIKLSDKPSCINNYVNKNTTVLLKDKFHKLLFERIRKRFKKDKNFAKFLGIHKATMSAWRLRKNRMPIYILKEICKALDLDFNKVSKNIAKTDREIAEII